MADLYRELTEYCNKDYIPMHMPGHKRNGKFFMENPYHIDITEIDGFDNYHHPEGILKSIMEEAAQLYRTNRTYLLVNGSSCGILAAISAVAGRGEKVIVARNSHKSLYNALLINDVYPVYIYPKIHEIYGINTIIDGEVVRDALEENRDAKAVMITSPTYEGVVSEIKEIADICHEYGVPLIVDEAHGAHFIFHDYFPQSAIELGADIVIQSLHKTLPSFTQTAVLHEKSGLVDNNRLRMYVSIYQSTSPSYILMSGMNQCIKYMTGNGKKDMEIFVENLKELRKGLEKLQYLKLIDTSDKSKIVISTKDTDISGKKLYNILLEQYHIQLEMASADYVIAMTTIGDEKANLERFLAALQEIDSTFAIRAGNGLIFANKELVRDNILQTWKAQVNMLQGEALKCDGETVEITGAEGRVSKEWVYLYPPGVPIICPGEVISREIIHTLQRYRKAGLALEGLADDKGEVIECVK